MRKTLQRKRRKKVSDMFYPNRHTQTHRLTLRDSHSETHTQRLTHRHTQTHSQTHTDSLTDTHTHRLTLRDSLTHTH